MYLRRPKKAIDVLPSDIYSGDFDFVIAAVGYEARSRHIGTSLTGNVGRKIAIAFEDGKELSYGQNLEEMAHSGFEIIEANDRDVGAIVLSILRSICTEQRKEIRGCIDVSSITRLRMGYILQALCSFTESNANLDITFAYNVAQYSAPGLQLELATTCGPVSPFFAGWPDDPERPVAAILGLGYEMEKALGALEYIEPAISLLVCPISKDPRYDLSVVDANDSLTSHNKTSELYRYHVDKGTDCIELLDALVSRLDDEFRILILPFGPKLFALCSMLIAIRDYPRVGVWRVSSDEPALRREQLPSEITVGLRVVF